MEATSNTPIQGKWRYLSEQKRGHSEGPGAHQPNTPPTPWTFSRPASPHPARDNVRDARKRQEALTKMKEAFEMTLAGEAATEKPQGNCPHSI